MAYPSIRDAGRREEMESRIRSLSPESERKWGKMRHDQLLQHLCDGFRIALDGTVKEAKGPIQFPPFRYVVLHLLKWPEGKIEAPPQAFQRDTEGWEEDRATLFGYLERYMSTPPEEVTGMHPAFGNMKPGDWDVLMYRHLDHHLRQFSA